ncbi:hypothetical protein PGT21_034252 [Puccinia graminis f. sp. tritici]|nr:hypothetical protein PGT21_034252 [Puccinia graminis f. sp. tritici]
MDQDGNLILPIEHRVGWRPETEANVFSSEPPLADWRYLTISSWVVVVTLPWKKLTAYRAAEARQLDGHTTYQGNRFITVCVVWRPTEMDSVLKHRNLTSDAGAALKLAQLECCKEKT